MFNRYELNVSYKGKNIFNGSFMSLNKAIKTACFFSDECVMYMYDYLNEKSYTSSFISTLIKEFKNGEIYL